MVPCEVTEVVQEGNLLFVEHPANDAGQLGPVDKDFEIELAETGEWVLTGAPTDDLVFGGFFLPQQDLVLDGNRFGAGTQLFVGVARVILLDPLGAVLHFGLDQVVVVANFPIRLGLVPFPPLGAGFAVGFIVKHIFKLIELAQLPEHGIASWAAGLHFQLPSNAVFAKRVSALENKPSQ